MTEKRKPLPDKEAADKLAVSVKEALSKLGITAFVMGGRMDGGHLAIIMKCSPIEAIVLDDASTKALWLIMSALLLIIRPS